MHKSIELTQTQIKAKVAGATMFLFPISDYDLNRIDKGYSIGDSFPIDKGDKDIFVQEDFRFNEYGDYEYKTGLNTKVISHLNINQWQKASQMTKEKSRYSFNECIDVRVVRVQDIKIVDISKLLGDEFYDNFGRKIDKFYNQQMQEQNIDRTYEDNDYVFLAEFA